MSEKMFKISVFGNSSGAVRTFRSLERLALCSLGKTDGRIYLIQSMKSWSERLGFHVGTFGEKLNLNFQIFKTDFQLKLKVTVPGYWRLSFSFSSLLHLN